MSRPHAAVGALFDARDRSLSFLCVRPAMRLGLTVSATTAPTSRPSTAKCLPTENFSCGNASVHRATAAGSACAAG